MIKFCTFSILKERLRLQVVTNHPSLNNWIKECDIKLIHYAFLIVIEYYVLNIFILL